MSRIRPWGRLGRRGIAAVEFAFVMPMLLLLVLAMADLMFHMRAVYRVERMAAEILNALAQVDPLTQAQVAAVLSAAPSIGGSSIATQDNAGATSDGAIHVTAIQRSSPTANARLWTRHNYTAGTPAGLVVSRLSTTPVLPAGVIVPAGAQVLAVEVLSQRTPWTSGITRVLTGGATSPAIYALAVAQPRTATLTGTLP
jgi:Flp pilus assembly protein TadG